jgi:hypothetical protein
MSERGTGFNGRRIPDPTEQPFRHVIAEYRHAAQTITCTCGWSGSSASTDGRDSAWSQHLAEHRPPKR